MKKFFAIILAAFLLASALCVPTFAALLETFDAAPVGVVLRVSELKKDGTTLDVIGDYHNFIDGWNAAIEAALTNDYNRIVVDFYADWTATDGEFCDDGVGFSYDAIYVPEDVRITLNLGGHTINRAMSDWEWNGEVMCIDENADVIINNGTITGGWSGNGAGGIHVKEKATVTLNDVHVDGNKADDDDGAGIALYDGATLIMNGGSLNNNELIGTNAGGTCGGGGIYAERSTVILDGVEIKNNQTFNDFAAGIAIYADESEVTLSNCIIDGNGIETDAVDSQPAFSMIHLDDSNLTVTKSNFTNNGTYFLSAGIKYMGGSSIVRMYDASSVNLEDCIFENNNVTYLFQSNGIEEGAVFYATRCEALNNNSAVYWGDATSVFKECTFNNNKSKNNHPVFENETGDSVSLIDCSMGDTTYLNEGLIHFEFSAVPKEEAVIGVSVIFKDGSTEFYQYYKDFASGWNEAMAHAVAASGYDRVVVDLYADWNTQEKEVISIPENVRVTINLNDHTINRGLAECKLNGEVIYVSPNAVLTINGGTITGGFSGNGAGGIHVESGASVILNDVHVDGNAVEDDDGAAIALYDGAVLVMNGGSLSNNYLIRTWEEFVGVFPYGTLYVNNSTATLNNVTISNNHTASRLGEGMAVYATNSTVTLNECTVKDNGLNSIRSSVATSVVTAVDSKLIVTNTDFTGNGCHDTEDDGSHLFYMEDSSLTMEGGNVTGNNTDKLFLFKESDADVKKVTVADNESVVLDVENDLAKVTLTECILGGNAFSKGGAGVVVETAGTLVLTDCDLGDTDFENKSMVTGVGSMLGEGSLTMIVALLGLIAGIASICVNVAMNKKKDSPATIAAKDEE